MIGSSPLIWKMADTITKEERSRVMRQVRSRGNKSTELKLAKLFRENKITGWRRHLDLVGKPDFAFPKSKAAIFIDGCFWHKCPKCYREPKSSKDYWQAKVEKNRKRDLRVTRELKAKGWRVLRIWECQLKKSPEKSLKRITKFLSI